MYVQIYLKMLFKVGEYEDTEERGMKHKEGEVRLPSVLSYCKNKDTFKEFGMLLHLQMIKGSFLKAA